MIALVASVFVALGASAGPRAPEVPASWPRLTVLDRVTVPAPPGFDREPRPLGARAAMLTLTDGTDTVIVTVYSDGAPDALRVHREELQKALAAGPPKATSRVFLGKRRPCERLQAWFEGVEVEAEVTAADLGARTVVVSFVRVHDGPNTTIIDQVVAGVALERAR